MLDTKQLEERRRLIDGFVNSVIVYDEYIVITFNYKEGTTTVPFSKWIVRIYHLSGDQNRQFSSRKLAVLTFSKAFSLFIASHTVFS